MTKCKWIPFFAGIIKISFFIFFLLIHPAYAKQNNKLKLFLNEAILLAVRDNPNVQTTQLNYISQKFSLYVQEWEFFPHYSLQASATLGRSGSPGQSISRSHNYTLQPG